VGRIVDQLFLVHYLRRLIKKRNRVIKEEAEKVPG